MGKKCGITWGKVDYVISVFIRINGASEKNDKSLASRGVKNDQKTDYIQAKTIFHLLCPVELNIQVGKEILGYIIRNNVKMHFPSWNDIWIITGAEEKKSGQRGVGS